MKGTCRSNCSATRNFPAIGKLPYLLTLGPHAFYWFALEQTMKQLQAMAKRGRIKSARINLHSRGRKFSKADRKANWKWRCESGCRPIVGLAVRPRSFKMSRSPMQCRLSDVQTKSPQAKYLALAQVEYVDGEPET